MPARAPGRPVRRFLVSVVVATVVLTLWGFLFWGYFARGLGMFHAVPDADALTDTLKARDLATATYFVPWPRSTPETERAFVEHHKTGSFYRLSYVREGVDPQSGTKIMLGVLHHAVVALLAGLLVFFVRDRPFGLRVLIVFVAGLMGTTFIRVADPVWFHMPWDFVGGVLLYECVAWLALAVVVAGLAVSRRTVSHSGLIMDF